MLAHSPKDRSRSPHRTNGNSNSTAKHLAPSKPSSHANAHETNDSSKSKKENESQLRLKSLKSFIQTLRHDLSALGSTHDEQVKALETACIKEFSDLSLDRIRRMIRSVFKSRKSSHTTSATLTHQDSATMSSSSLDRFTTNETPNGKKSRPNSTTTNAVTKPSDLVPPSASALSGLDADFLRHAFSQQFHPSLDLASYFSPAAGNGTGSTSPLFRSNFSPSNFLQSLTGAPPPPSLPSTLVSSHTHLNGNHDSSTTSGNKSVKSIKLSNSETSSIKVLVNAYREAASYLSRSADELEQLF